MSAQWFYARGSDTLGPYSASDLRILLEHGEIRPETLVWREGIAWVAVGTLPEFATSPRPHSSPHPEPVEGRGRGTTREPRGTPALRRAQGEGAGSVAPQEKGAGYAESQGKGANRRTSSPHGEPVEPRGRATARNTPNSPHPEPVEGRGRATPSPQKLATPLPRLIARLIDAAVHAGLFWGMHLLNPVLRHYLYPTGVLLEELIVFSLRVTPVYVALLFLFLFKETPGKLLVGIRAVPLDGRKHLSFVENLTREIRVLRTALFSPFQLFADWDAIARGEPASYDVGHAKVVEHAESVVWRTFMVMLAPLIIGGILYSTFYESRRARTAVILPPPKLENTVPKPVPAGTMAKWKNPESEIIVSIPADWRQDGYQGGGAINFANDAKGLVAYFECTTMPEGMNSFADYEALTAEALPSLGTFAPFADAPGSTRRTATGTLTHSPLAALVIIGPGGEGFCQLTYIDIINANSLRLEDAALTKALFESAGG